MSVVFNAQDDIGERGNQANDRQSGGRVFINIDQAFLDQAIEGDQGVVVQAGIIDSAAMKSTWIRFLAENSSQVLLDGFDQPQLI